MIEPGRSTPRCRSCGAAGHNVRTCPDPLVPAESLAAIAEIRERMDAIGTELLEYERVHEVVARRIAADRAELARLSIDIARLRRGAT